MASGPDVPGPHRVLAVPGPHSTPSAPEPRVRAAPRQVRAAALVLGHSFFFFFFFKIKNEKYIKFI